MLCWQSSEPDLKMAPKSSGQSQTCESSDKGTISQGNQLLVYNFRDGLNQELYHTCLPRGIPDWIRDWYQLATVVELNIMEYKRHRGMKASQKRARSSTHWEGDLEAPRCEQLVFQMWPGRLPSDCVPSTSPQSGFKSHSPIQAKKTSKERMREITCGAPGHGGLFP